MTSKRKFRGNATVEVIPSCFISRGLSRGRMRILDLYCGAGGASMGYHRAFPEAEIVGVDINPQPRYPFTFVQADALEYPLDGFDFVHASPPCQAFCQLSAHLDHPDLIGKTRERFGDISYVIENVPGAPLINPIRLCGSSFGLVIQRHRHFEIHPMIRRFFDGKPCDHSWWTPRFFQNDYGRKDKLSNVVAVYGASRFTNDYQLRCAAMGITWMTIEELSQAVPPAYTEYIGNQLKFIFSEIRRSKTHC
jgi:DNA (cytosine-5)-methyltransferase 1